MPLGRAVPVDGPPADRPSALVALAIVRGGGAPVVQRRLPARVPVTVGRRERHGFRLEPDWVPLDLARIRPVPGGWLVSNACRTPMSLVNDWIRGGTVDYNPHATVMLQRGEHRISWPGLRSPVALSVSVRSRRRDDERIAYVVDGGPDVRPGGWGGATDPPLSDATRYRLAVLFQHLLEGEPAPLHLVRRGAMLLGITEEELQDTAHRYRRRLNQVRGTDLQSLEELGDHLVAGRGVLSVADLNP